MTITSKYQQSVVYIPERKLSADEYAIKGFELATALPALGCFIPEAMTQLFCEVCLILCGSKSKQPPAIREGDLGCSQQEDSDQLQPVTHKHGKVRGVMPF